MNTDLPTPNIPLLRKAVEWAEAEAAKTDGTCMWNQLWYAEPRTCGTAYCIAGYAVSIQPSHEPVTDATAIVDGVNDSYAEHARRLLGITDDESFDLFAANNRIGDVRRIAEEIAARAGERL